MMGVCQDPGWGYRSQLTSTRHYLKCFIHNWSGKQVCITDKFLFYFEIQCLFFLCRDTRLPNVSRLCGISPPVSRPLLYLTHRHKNRRYTATPMNYCDLNEWELSLFSQTCSATNVSLVSDWWLSSQSALGSLWCLAGGEGAPCWVCAVLCLVVFFGVFSFSWSHFDVSCFLWVAIRDLGLTV